MPGKFLFINSEILGQHSVGIDKAFATMGYLLVQFSLVLVQPNCQGASITFYGHLVFQWSVKLCCAMQSRLVQPGQRGAVHYCEVKRSDLQ